MSVRRKELVATEEEAARSEARGRLLSARTGSRQRDTQVACAKKAPRNLGGEERMLSKRESWPSEVMRAKRKDPTAGEVNRS